tara:strand:+ start:682 stop:1251 length:570 start_codon:yes stop_codon:yes gene_type:complete
VKEIVVLNYYNLKMKSKYCCINNYLNDKQIKDINNLYKNTPDNFKEKANTLKTSTAKKIPLLEILKIQNVEHTIIDINRKVFGFDIYENINDGVIQNKYTNKGQYKWHYDGESFNHNYTIKLTTLINVSEEEYTGGKFMLFDGKPLHIKEFDKPGSLVCFPSYILHKVTPVTKGERTTLTVFKTGRWWK